MKILGKTNIFIEDVTTKNGEIFHRYTTSISGKDKAGNYENKSIDVRFAGKNFPAEKLAKLDATNYYVVDIVDGFISVRKGKDEKKYLELVVTDAKIIGHGPKAKPVQEDLPF